MTPFTAFGTGWLWEGGIEEGAERGEGRRRTGEREDERGEWREAALGHPLPSAMRVIYRCRCHTFTTCGMGREEERGEWSEAALGHPLPSAMRKERGGEGVITQCNS